MHEKPLIYIFKGGHLNTQSKQVDLQSVKQYKQWFNIINIVTNHFILPHSYWYQIIVFQMQMQCNGYGGDSK